VKDQCLGFAVRLGFKCAGAVAELDFRGVIG